MGHVKKKQHIVSGNTYLPPDLGLSYSLVLILVCNQGESVRAVKLLHAGVAIRQVDHSGHGRCRRHTIFCRLLSP